MIFLQNLKNTPAYKRLDLSSLNIERPSQSLVHFKSQTILKSHDWLKSYVNVIVGFAKECFFSKGEEQSS